MRGNVMKLFNILCLKPSFSTDMTWLPGNIRYLETCILVLPYISLFWLIKSVDLVCLKLTCSFMSQNFLSCPLGWKRQNYVMCVNRNQFNLKQIHTLEPECPLQRIMNTMKLDAVWHLALLSIKFYKNL